MAKRTKETLKEMGRLKELKEVIYDLAKSQS